MQRIFKVGWNRERELERNYERAENYSGTKFKKSEEPVRNWGFGGNWVDGKHLGNNEKYIEESVEMYFKK